MLRRPPTSSLLVEDPLPAEPHEPVLPPPRRRSMIDSFLWACHGLLECAERQQNMRVHIVAAVLVGLAGSGIPLGLAEKVTLIFCVILVFFAEVLNTAIEALVDLHTEDFRELARTTKDAAAAGVLVLAFGTVVIFAALVVHNWPAVVAHAARVARQAAVGGPLAAATAILLWQRAKPRWLDLTAFGAGLGLLALLATWTTSIVFSAMTAGLFGFAALVAWRGAAESA